MNLGDIQIEQGSLEEARTSTLRSLKLKSDNPTALMKLVGYIEH